MDDCQHHIHQLQRLQGQVDNCRDSIQQVRHLQDQVADQQERLGVGAQRFLAIENRLESLQHGIESRLDGLQRDITGIPEIRDDLKDLVKVMTATRYGMRVVWWVGSAAVSLAGLYVAIFRK